METLLFIYVLAVWSFAVAAWLPVRQENGVLNSLLACALIGISWPVAVAQRVLFE